MNETWWVHIGQLDEAQKAVLAASPDKSLLIVGPPGSGKTNILMLRANYVRHANPRQLLLTFTRSLTEHLRSGPSIGRADQIKEKEIMTFMSWARWMIRQHGGKLPEENESNFTQDRITVLDELNTIVVTKKLGKLYDVIFVDEVQDFLENELRLLARLSYRVNFAGDARQRIWRSDGGLATAEELADEVCELEFHYRIGEKICEYADQILPPKSDERPLLDGCNYQEGRRPSSVVTSSCVDETEAMQRCLETLRNQVRYIVDEPIGVLALRNDLLDEFMNVIGSDTLLGPMTVRQKSGDYHPYDHDSRIRVMTVHSAKGSEFRAVHLLGGEGFKLNNKELGFTAVTRAKTELTVYHVATLMGHMVPATGLLPTDLASIF